MPVGDFLSWNSVSPNIFYSKNDAADPRLGDWAQSLSCLPEKLNQEDWVIVGYPDDEGIQLNGGRVGAKEAPDRIRNFFYRMTPDPRSHVSQKILDLGNLNTNSDLANRHQQARNLIFNINQKRGHWISLGGGHDYGFSDAAGFLEHYVDSNLTPIVINFDAHLDVRPTNNGYHSGTAFRRLLNEFKGRFHFLEVGLQPHCNAKEHLNWAKDQGVKCVFLEEIQNRKLTETVINSFEMKNHPVFVSLDIDALRSSEAPGCSAISSMGLHLEDVVHCLKKLKQVTQMKGLGIYEVSPPLDTDDRTSKLAALIMHHVLFA